MYVSQFILCPEMENILAIETKNFQKHFPIFMTQTEWKPNSIL